MYSVYLGLGSNIAPKVDYLKKAVEKLSHKKDIIIEKVSSLYLTKPYGYEKQADFINAVVFLKTPLMPEKLKKIIVNIEDELGRVRTKKKGPQKIDIDILFYNQLNYQSGNLTIPRPGITKKAFVLIPLIEVAEQELFIENVSIEKWLQKLNYKSDEVKLFGDFPD